MAVDTVYPRRYVRVTFYIPEKSEGTAINLLDELGFSGSESSLKPIDGKIKLTAYFPGEIDIDTIIGPIEKSFPGADTEIRYEYIEGRDWEGNCKRAFQPVMVSDDLVILSPWDEAERFINRDKVIINPAAGFGTGRHPSTILCLRALGRVVRKGDRILDFGSGSGILSIYSKMLGASSVDGVEIDPAAIANAIENLKLNKINGGVEFTVDFDSISGRRYNIVVSNIDYETMKSYLARLKKLMNSGGHLIASGFEEHEENKLASLLNECSVKKYRIDSLDGWMSVTAVV
jgi:ribosomal protein L11 methyltransferase